MSLEKLILLIEGVNMTKVEVKLMLENTKDLPIWVKWFLDRYDYNENNFENDKELSKGWHWTHLKYTTCKGSSRAWCAMSMNTALETNGIHGTGSAAASSFSKYGEPCGYKLGAILPILHPSKKHHVNIFIKWHDEKNMLAWCLGGNQGDSINLGIYNLSGNAHGHDEVMRGGPRFPGLKNYEYSI